MSWFLSAYVLLPHSSLMSTRVEGCHDCECILCMPHSIFAYFYCRTHPSWEHPSRRLGCLMVLHTLCAPLAQHQSNQVEDLGVSWFLSAYLWCLTHPSPKQSSRRFHIEVLQSIYDKWGTLESWLLKCHLDSFGDELGSWSLYFW